MSQFISAVEDLVRSLHKASAEQGELEIDFRQLIELAATAPPVEIDRGLGLLGQLIPTLALEALGAAGISCGCLVERGGNPAVTGPALLARLVEMNQAVIDFQQACRTRAELDGPFVEQLRADLEAPTASLSPSEVVARHVDEMGWDELAQRFGPALAETHAGPLSGFLAMSWFERGLIAHLARSADLRRAARARSELLQTSRQALGDDGFLVILLQVLDDESLLVLHVEQQKGLLIRISGIADNFQLHTLLAAAFADDLGGNAPSVRAIALFTGAERDAEEAESVTGPFNLWSWRGLGGDQQLRVAAAASEHWIWNEGCPADIPALEGQRIVLLGPAPYLRSWNAERTFPGMAGELLVERSLTASETAGWLSRLARAANP